MIPSSSICFTCWSTLAISVGRLPCGRCSRPRTNFNSRLFVTVSSGRFSVPLISFSSSQCAPSVCALCSSLRCLVALKLQDFNSLHFAPCEYCSLPGHFLLRAAGLQSIDVSRGPLTSLGLEEFKYCNNHLQESGGAGPGA